MPRPDPPVRPLTADEQALVVEHLYLVPRLTTRFRRRAVRFGTPQLVEEFDFAAEWALCMAAQKFRPGRCRFEPFAGQRIRWALCDVLDDYSRRREVIGEQLLDDNIVEDPGRGSCQDGAGEALDHLLARIPRRQRVIVRLLRDGWDRVEVAQQLRISRTTIHTWMRDWSAILTAHGFTITT